MSSTDRRTDGGAGRSYRGRLALLSVLSLCTVGFLIHRELVADRPYRVHQERYREIQLRAEGRAEPLDIHIRQVNAAGGAERCPSCHVGIADRPLKAASRLPNPYRSHPGFLLASHPPGRFGCIACHGAGEATVDRCLPSLGDPDGRSLNARRVQASCPSCHAGVEGLPGAERLAEGLLAYRRLGCGGCHRVKGLHAGRPIGPPLAGIQNKRPAAFIRDFLARPQSLRRGTAMPSFFAAEVMEGAPRFTALRLAQRGASEREDLLAFVLSTAPRKSGTTSRVLDAPGGVAQGRVLFRRLGCVACHRTETDAAKADARGALGGVGPDLQQAGRTLFPDWTDRWLALPRALWPETRMPDFRLSGAERRYLTCYLGSLGGEEAMKRAPEAQPEAAAVRRGRALAEKLGCGGCHPVEALRDAPPAGPDLDGFGDKPVDLLDWGHAPEPARARSTWRWMELKLTRPLCFDRRPGVLLMPWQALRSHEAEGIILVLRSLSSVRRAPELLAHPPREVTRRRAGERPLEDGGCRQCHTVRGRGGAIGQLVLRPSDRPPALEGEGTKVQPGWLYGFLRRPIPLRPWLETRMPTPRFDGSRREMLVASLAAEDHAAYPFVEQEAPRLEKQRLEQALALFDRFQCLRCHLLSNAPRLNPGELSPDLALSGSRLLREWIHRFILEPQQVMPGTRMPTLFPLADEDDLKSRTTPLPQYFGGSIGDQVDALTDLNLWWGSAEAARRGR